VSLISLAYEGHPITIRDDGWFNATEAAKRFGQDVHEWLRLPKTQRYLEALGKAVGLKPGKSRFALVKAKRGGKDAGTWLHPKLAVAFARWLDDDFAVWCDCKIDDIIRGKQDWSRLRHISTASAKMLHAVIKDSKEAQGKALKQHHFSNEHCLVNSLLTGQFKGLNRDALAGWQLDFVGHFDLRDGILIAKGLSYQERKTMLVAEAIAWRTINAHRIEGSNDPGALAA